MHEGGRNEEDHLTTLALEHMMDTETLSSFDVTFSEPNYSKVSCKPSWYAEKLLHDIYIISCAVER